jgi:hypothetical protein
VADGEHGHRPLAFNLVQGHIPCPPEADHHLAQQGVFRPDLAAGKGELLQKIECLGNGHPGALGGGEVLFR